MAAALTSRHIRALAALAAATIGLTALCAAPAGANPPTITSAGASGGLVGATWSLPASVRSNFFEIARYPDVNVYGYFREKLVRPPGDPLNGAESQVRFGVLGAAQTSLTDDDPEPPLPAGTYYVHIAGHDSLHTGCPQIEFSDIMAVVIDAGGTASVTSTPVAPGTGACTLRPGGGSGGRSGGGSGGGTGGGSGGVFAGDETPPRAKFRYRRRQDIDKLYVRARMSEPGTVTAKALVDVGGLLARIYTFRRAKRKVSGGVLAKLRLRIAKRKKRALKRAMRRHKRLRARVTLTAVDRAGNTVTKHAVIRLRR